MRKAFNHDVHLTEKSLSFLNCLLATGLDQRGLLLSNRLRTKEIFLKWHFGVFGTTISVFARLKAGELKKSDYMAIPIDRNVEAEDERKFLIKLGSGKHWTCSTQGHPTPAVNPRGDDYDSRYDEALQRIPKNHGFGPQ